MIERAHAVLGLAWQLFLHLVRAPFRMLWGFDAGARFLENYAPDGFVVVSAEDRRRFPDFSRCIACGICALPEMERAVAGGGGAPALALSLSRFLGGPSKANTDLANAPDLDEVAGCIEAMCPTRVPVRDILRVVRERGARFEG